MRSPGAARSGTRHHGGREASPDTLLMYERMREAMPLVEHPLHRAAEVSRLLPYTGWRLSLRLLGLWRSWRPWDRGWAEVFLNGHE